METFDGTHEFRVNCYGMPWNVIHSAQEQIILQAQEQGGSARSVYNHGAETLTVMVSGDHLFRNAYEAAVRHWFATR